MSATSDGGRLEADRADAPLAIDLNHLQDLAERARRRCVVGALIVDGAGRVFVHRRGPDRAFLAGAWDIPGGHVEPGETLMQALEREVREETGWQLIGTPSLVHVADWQTDERDPSSWRREFDFLVEVAGDLRRPHLERPKHTEFRWLGDGELAILDENRGRDQGLVRHLVELAAMSRVTGRLAYPHATLFLEGPTTKLIESHRATWDPAMASQIRAHITVAYPSDAHGIIDMIKRVKLAARATSPFRLRLAEAGAEGGPVPWVFVRVVDEEGGWRELRWAIVPDRPATTPPHVTIVHPRTSALGGEAMRHLRGREFGQEFVVRDVAVTARDGYGWRTIQEFALSGAPVSRAL